MPRKKIKEPEPTKEIEAIFNKINELKIMRNEFEANIRVYEAESLGLLNQITALERIAVDIVQVQNPKKEK